jgi:hypothetical protein
MRRTSLARYKPKKITRNWHKNSITLTCAMTKKLLGDDYSGGCRIFGIRM